MFQQRHFEAIAQMMQEIKPNNLRDIDVKNERDRQWCLTLNALSELFARHNSRFNLGRFERACEPGADVRARKVA